LTDRYSVICLETDYTADAPVPNHTGMITGDLCGSVLEKSKFIDGAAIAFIAEAAGAMVTTWDGNPPPPLHTCADYERPGLIIAASQEIHQHLLQAVQTLS
jgi:fructose-1,6-bisphosphatase/inositol monophosphatase family enzyme